MALAILSAPGSRGDVNPMIAIGAMLRQRGYDVIISLAQPYATVAEAAGLNVCPVIDRGRFDHLLSNPSVWKPIRGARAIVREVIGDFLPLHDEVIRANHMPGETILVSHPLDLASRIFRETDPTTPLVDVHLSPVVLRTFDAPPRMTPWWFEFSRPAWMLRVAYWLVDTVAVDPIIVGKVNRLRSHYSLPPIRRVIDQWWLSPDRILAMYPDWFAPATKSFAPRLVHCGFPLFDADDSTFAAPTDRPIVFTAGTAHRHCRDFFASAVDACTALDYPGLLVSSHPQNLPSSLPPHVRTAGYVPFSSLLPHCAAIVHHGGIGTTSQSLAAGIPQLVRPMAFDQFDNATRVDRLGCGQWLRSNRRLTEVLGHILTDESMHSRCKEVAVRLHRRAAEVAADEIDRMARRDDP